MEAKEILRVHNVSKTFGSGHTAVKALHGIHLHVTPADIVLIMGPSGSGKTTLLTIAGGLLKPTSGEVMINGRDIVPMSETKLPAVRRDNIGFVFQSFNLLDALTALENVEIALFLRGIKGVDAQKRATELLTQLGLKDRLHFRSNQLSGGEKQRVAVARALANDPKIILADEPTANLDAKNGHQVMMLLCQIACQEQRAVVIVSHDERLRSVAKRVITIEDGQLVRQETGEHNRNCRMEHRDGHAH
jgi:putative ABC transport system ATP-binding protein